MAQFFRTATPMGDWRELDFTCDVSGGVESGELLRHNDTVGICFNAADFGDNVRLIYEIEKAMVDKLTGSGEDIAEGEWVYWSGVYGTGVSANYTSGWYKIGICVAAAGEDDTSVMIDLFGKIAEIGE